MSGAAGVPQSGNGLIDKWRADRALLDRKQIMRIEFVISDSELRFELKLKAGTIPVVPRRGGMDQEICIQVYFGNSAQILLKNRSLDFELMSVLGVLIMTASAGLKVGTAWLNPMRGTFDNSVGSRSSKSAFLLQQRGFNLLALQYKRHEYGFAAAMLVGRQASEAVAAIDQFFDSEEQSVI